MRSETSSYPKILFSAGQQGEKRSKVNQKIKKTVDVFDNLSYGIRMIILTIMCLVSVAIGHVIITSLEMVIS